MINSKEGTLQLQAHAVLCLVNCAIIIVTVTVK